MGFTRRHSKLCARTRAGQRARVDHVIERAVLMSSSNVVTAFDLALQSTPDARLSARLEEMSLEDAERL